jgi:hypothetical protein
MKYTVSPPDWYNPSHPATSQHMRIRFTLFAAAGIVSVLACSLPPLGSGQAPGPTGVAQTVWALQTKLSATETAGSQPLASTPMPLSGPTPTPAGPVLPSATIAVANPVVTTLALCWTGPGPAYRVVSSVPVGASVTLLGVGSKEGWFIIENPRYHERCWIEAQNLQLDPYLNVSQLKVFNPPPTPGPKPTPGPSPTP